MEAITKILTRGALTMTNYELFDRPNKKLKDNLEVVSRRIDRKHIIQKLSEECGKLFTTTVTSGRIVLALDGRKNTSRIEKDINESIANVMTDEEKRMMVSIDKRDRTAEIRIRRS